MEKKKGLQKLTKPNRKINRLLKLDCVTREDVKTLNKTERTLLFRLIKKEAKALGGSEANTYLNRFTEIFATETRNQLWENNHVLITGAISNLLIEYNRMPSCSEIALQTGLTRQTVDKHLKNFKGHEMFLEQAEQFKIAVPSLLARVYKFAMNGDISAAKLYFKMLGYLNEAPKDNGTLIQNQNNFIQINGTVLSQETIKQLNPEQLNTIENILKTALPPPKVIELFK